MGVPRWAVGIVVACLVGIIIAICIAAFEPSSNKRGRWVRVAAWFRAALVPLAIATVAIIVAALAWRGASQFIAKSSMTFAAQQGGGGIAAEGGGKCSAAGAEAAKTCGAEDPVSDPDYNMKEIAKQSILLEEHLIEKNKRCKDCIVKHFLHIIALAEEAQCLAGSNLSKYPYMDDSPAYYKKQYERWMANRDDDHTYRKVDDQLRKRRKLLVAYYILGDGVTGTPHLDG